MDREKRLNMANKIKELSNEIKIIRAVLIIGLIVYIAVILLQ